MGRHRRKKRVPGPVRTGLLGIAAAAAVGTVAVAAGLVPGGDVFTTGSQKTAAQHVREAATGDLEAQGGSAATPSQRASAGAAARPSKGMSSTAGKTQKGSPSATAAKPKPPVTKKAPPAKPSAAPGSAEAPGNKAAERKAAPERRAVPAKPRPAAPSGETAAEAEVLALVNKERAKVGCAPVRADASLNRLAGRFSSDMAARGFFDHTDPEGDGPWDRAAQAGVGGLGAENIARGQADARTVMNAWMNSDGHRANILNCEYRTLGVGVSFAQGGPWWTQDFGF
ncbi:CAP domain-containing protein [Streptomyces sp. HNM0645]|uniref:CAP domain-containing protein n=1 Tax=Streptomyces sp. HNM0645 TaxID=2782343 RepID=UPI0024B84ABB|nr:CAP domain-containing protein [Streptomyces sp. HNM0645]MDI9885268.1 CAP domain-containing protein [Streptomyces sp. HNM0645]